MSQEKKKPNVLLICADHWPGSLLGDAGHERILTPTLDEICGQGVRFTQAYSTTPTCIPARRALMTGTSAVTHGDRIFSETLPMDPNLPTLAQCFRDAGYQAFAAGKMHVYPQRDRIGFDDVILCEEGRHQFGMPRDDYELFVQEQGCAGQEFAHAMGNNRYCVRPWHLPEHLHPTHWTTRQACRLIQRRDPRRPGFWYCSYIAPHPPLTPLKDYLDMYLHLGVDEPVIGEWTDGGPGDESLPYALRKHRHWKPGPERADAVALARAAFYAQCTYIDHQIRLLLGTLREEGLADDTIVMFTSDHGDMLGTHGHWAKSLMFEGSVGVPMVLMPHRGADVELPERGDDRLAALRDVMPTLLDLCGIEAPGTVEGLSLVGQERRDHIYCEHNEDDMAVRMVRTDRYKLIYYPVGNRFQLFDMKNDPRECRDLAGTREHREVQQQLTSLLLEELHGTDSDWIENGRLRGLPDKAFEPRVDRGLGLQRGWR